MKRKQYFILFCFVSLCLFVMGKGNVLAHSLVEQETPSPNSHLEASPTEIIIVFNGKIEKELLSLKVLDEKQQEVTSNKVQINSNQQEIRLKIPDLVDGIYHVQYYAISSNDGHPVKGSYRFQITSPPSVIQIEDNADLCIPNGYQPQETSQFIESKGIEWMIFFARAIYYAGLLLIVGWIFWWWNIKDYSPELKKKFIAYGMVMQILHLTGLISMILIQLNIFTNFGLDFSNDFLIDSTFGLMWFCSLLVTLVGFISLFRNKWFDLIWVFLVVILKSLNGHSMEFTPTSALIFSNSIHLFSASIWAAGLFFILLFWRKQRIFVFSFLPIFSKYSLWSIVVLTITGLFATASFLSSNPLSLNPWLLILLFKLLIVIAVVVTGGIIRSKLKRQHTMGLSRWIKFDFILMMIIVILVSIFTYFNPLS